MILALAPHLVGDFPQTTPIEPGNGFSPATRAWVTQDRTEPGHIGDPRGASAEKGEWLFRRFAGDVEAFLERVIAWNGISWDA